jgi:hypothetical protein
MGPTIANPWSGQNIQVLNTAVNNPIGRSPSPNGSRPSSPSGAVSPIRAGSPTKANSPRSLTPTHAHPKVVPPPILIPTPENVVIAQELALALKKDNKVEPQPPKPQQKPLLWTNLLFDSREDFHKLVHPTVLNSVL